MIDIILNLRTPNGTAEGVAKAVDSAGAAIHRARGDWNSAETRSRFCRKVAAKVYPDPVRADADDDDAHRSRVEQVRRDRDKAAAELETLLLAKLGEAEAAQVAKAAAPATPKARVMAGGEGAGVLSKQDPLPTARKFLADRFRHADRPMLLYAGDVLFWWHGVAYEEVEPAGLRAGIYPWLELHTRWVQAGDTEKLAPFQPTKGDVNLAVDALQAVTYTARRDPPWLVDDPGLPDPATLLVATNGLFDLNRADAPVIDPTPHLFTTNALDYAVDPSAPAPAEWLQFLNLLWPTDPASIDLLREWMGYCLTADTSQQKILMLIGPKRSGKGTIARVLARVLGLANVCGPTLAGLATNFGLWPLIGNRLAVVSDARLSGRTDQAVVTERRLTISGEDNITIDRKNLPPLTVKLPTRIMLLTNELPRLNDASGALASRFLVLVLRESFYGREDTGLTDRLLAEVPAILNWAVAGWRRLRGRGRFVQPATGQEAIDELADLASPVGAFLREWCDVRPGLVIDTSDLFDAWRAWCDDCGRTHPGDAAAFGRDLRAAVPGVGSGQRRDPVTGQKPRTYKGVDLQAHAKATLAHWRMMKSGQNNQYAGTTP